MRFVLEKEKLTNNLAILVGVATKKNINIPILQNVKIEAINNQLILTATDLDTTIKNNFELNIEENGVITVPAQTLFDIIKKMNDGSEILFEYTENDSNLIISSGNSKFKLPCLDAEGFPTIEDIDMEEECTISRQDFIEIIDKSRFAISVDEARYYLNGLFFHTKEIEDNNYFIGSTTDGHKLAVIRKNQTSTNFKINGYIIPKKTLGEMKKMLEIDEEEVQLSFSKTKVKLATKNNVLISKLIDADYPDYERVIPKNNDKVLTIDKKTFSNALDRVSTVVAEKHKGVKFVIANGNLELSAETQENGTATENLPINYNEESIEIGFNSRYLLDILMQIESDEILIKLNNGNAPIIVQGTEELNNIFVLMPIRI